MNSLTHTPEVNTGGSSDTADWTLVASYESYEEAQRAVDRLSDESFPVENIEIVGRDLRIVERVTGRLTTGRATLAGAGTGAWWGLFIGLLVGLSRRAQSGSAWSSAGSRSARSGALCSASSRSGRHVDSATSRRCATWLQDITT